MNTNNAVRCIWCERALIFYYISSLTVCKIILQNLALRYKTIIIWIEIFIKFQKDFLIFLLLKLKQKFMKMNVIFFFGGGGSCPYDKKFNHHCTPLTWWWEDIFRLTIVRKHFSSGMVLVCYWGQSKSLPLYFYPLKSYRISLKFSTC